jgi:chromosome segregation ATPase
MNLEDLLDRVIRLENENENFEWQLERIHERLNEIDQAVHNKPSNYDVENKCSDVRYDLERRIDSVASDLSRLESDVRYR